MADTLIAIVDDDPLVRTATSSLIRSIGYACLTFASAEDYLSSDREAVDCVLSDIQMPGMSGIELAQAIHARSAPPPVLLMSAFPNERAAALRAIGVVHDFLEKPLNGDVVSRAIRAVLIPAGAR